MKNGEIIQEFTRVFLLAPELARNALSEALKGKYEVTFAKIVPIRSDVQEEHIYQFPMATAEKGVPVK